MERRPWGGIQPWDGSQLPQHTGQLLERRRSDILVDRYTEMLIWDKKPELKSWLWVS